MPIRVKEYAFDGINSKQTTTALGKLPPLDHLSEEKQTNKPNKRKKQPNPANTKSHFDWASFLT